MKKSLILRLTNIVLQNHQFASDALWASFPGALSSLPDPHRELVVQKYSVITETTVVNLEMLTTLAAHPDEIDQTLSDAISDFKSCGVLPEILRG